MSLLLIGCACWLPTGCCRVRRVGTAPPHWMCLSVVDRVWMVGTAPPHWVCLSTVRLVGVSSPHWMCFSVADSVSLDEEGWHYSSSLGVLVGCRQGVVRCGGLVPLLLS